MPQLYINTGSKANDRTGDPLRNAFIKTNSNFTELYSNVNVLPSSAIAIRGATFFNFSIQDPITYQALKRQSYLDDSASTGKWDQEDTIFYAARNGTITKFIITISQNTNATFAYIKNPTINTLVKNTTFDAEYVLTSQGSYTRYNIDVNLPMNQGDYYGFAFKTNTSTIKLFRVTLIGYMEFT